jgi:uncharacterized membrane protein HdeD (DUF308 family)
MSLDPVDPNAKRFGFFVIAMGVLEIALAVGLTAFTGIWWILLLGLLAIPNFVIGFRAVRTGQR